MSENQEDLRKKLDDSKPQVRERFFNIIVEKTEPAIDAEKVETLFHYESRVRLLKSCIQHMIPPLIKNSCFQR